MLYHVTTDVSESRSDLQEQRSHFGKFYSVGFPRVLLGSLVCELPKGCPWDFSPNLVNFTDSDLMKSPFLDCLDGEISKENPGWRKHCYWERERCWSNCETFSPAKRSSPSKFSLVTIFDKIGSIFSRLT